jgi:hypothetical protein
MRLTKEVLTRFESYYRRGNENECWPWLGSKQSRGYGFFGLRASGVSRKTYSAHRLAWSIANSRDIPSGKMICHTCDNPSCVNPKHLYLGTGFDNNSDTVVRGRANRKTGEQCSWAKLTEQDVLAILESKEKQVILARRYKVSQSHISHLKSCKRKLWTRVKA